jgi:shikimate dehydrogenase
MAKFKLAVLGQDGIERYSLSPLIHDYFFKKTKIDGEYKAIPVVPTELQNKLKQLQNEGYTGVNLTIPHKINVLPFLDEIDTVTEKIGAVNTILFKDGKIKGFNTDCYGFTYQLHNYTVKHPVVFGAGGASRAIVHGLKMDSIIDVVICNRTNEKAEQLAKEFECKWVKWEDRQSALKDRDLLINTTSCGMNGNDSLDIDVKDLPSKSIVYDIVYTPLLTPLLKQAKKEHYDIINGIGMLLYQAAGAYKIWFDIMPEVLDDLVQTCLEFLKEKE